MVATLAEGVVPLLGATTGCDVGALYVGVEKNTFVLLGSIRGLCFRNFVCPAHPLCCGTVSKNLILNKTPCVPMSVSIA